MLPKVVKQNGAHELFMNTYIVVGQRYYYIDCVISVVMLVTNITTLSDNN